jgi:N6-L-threonylcarbamoyladenine synthase
VDAEGAAPAGLAFPLLALIVSGGHTELIVMRDHGDYAYLGGTLDDAAGEAFDKVGRLLGLPYPGGPSIEAAAREGDPSVYHFPRSWLEETYDFSFSGLKTAVVRAVEQHGGVPRGRLVADMAVSFQEAVIDVLAAKTVAAAAEHGVSAILLCGGVSANQALRETVRERTELPVYYPPPFLCTDNAAMIAACGHFRFLAGERAGWDLDVEPGLRLAQALQNRGLGL